MIIAGFGFNSGATRQSFLGAMEMAVAFAESQTGAGIGAIATAEDKEIRVLQYLAGQNGLPLLLIRLGEISEAPVGTTPNSPARYGNRRLAEAAALIGAGPGGQLLGERMVSPDGTVTVALAEGPGRQV